MGMRRHDRAFGGLYQDPAGTLEGDLEALSAPAAREGLEGDVAPYVGPHAAAPGDGRVGVGEGGGAGVQEDRLPVGGDGDRTGPLEDHVEEAAGEPARALDPPYVPVDARLEGQDVLAVDRHPLVVELQEHDLFLLIGQAKLSGPGGRHELDALSGHGLLEEAPQVPALVLEA